MVFAHYAGAGLRSTRPSARTRLRCPRFGPAFSCWQHAARRPWAGLGYLLLENGIFLFGLLLLEAMPLIVELGVLLDLFTGVFVMGIVSHHINREFASAGTEHVTELKE